MEHSSLYSVVLLFKAYIYFKTWFILPLFNTQVLPKARGSARNLYYPSKMLHLEHYLNFELIMIKKMKKEKEEWHVKGCKE